MNSGHTLTIRKAEASDSRAIQSLAYQLGYTVSENSVVQQLKALKTSGHCVFVADDENEGVVGWVEIFPRKLLIIEQETPWAEIGGLVVDKAHRRKGIGRQLLLKAEGWCWESGYHGIVIRCNTKRDGAHQFYPDLGYRLSHDQAIYLKTEPN